MSEVDRLFTEYVSEHQAGGEADPRSFLARASPDDRAELAALIDGYLIQAPRRAIDPETIRGSAVERTVDELERVLGGRSGLWPALLPRLRDRIGLKRSELVQQLADALGVGSRSEKVAGYYHQMEQGILPAAGVTDRVLEALSRLLGESEESLREAGRAVRPPGEAGAPASAAFARVARSETAMAPPGTAPEPVEPAEWDEVDQLFRGAR
jgi:hypothetical protein